MTLSSPFSIVITKRINPYNLLEGLNKYFDVCEYIFDSVSKKCYKEKFEQNIKNSPGGYLQLGFYLKNVNKFYYAKIKDEYKQDLDAFEKYILKTTLEFKKSDIEQKEGLDFIDNHESAISDVDLAKAEVAFIAL